MKTWKAIVIAVVAAMLAGSTAYVLGLRRAWPLVQFLAAQPMLLSERRAADAYQNQKPEVAIWALEQVVSQMTAQVALPVENPWCRRDSLEFDLMLTHGRIARLYESLGDSRGQDHLLKALQFAQKACPTDHLDRAQLFAVIERFDAIGRKEEANQASDATSKPAPGAGSEAHQR